MRPIHALVHARTRVEARYALMPLEGFPPSRLPGWEGADVRVLASPALGAKFVQMRIDLPPGGRGRFVASADVQTFVFTLTGEGRLSDESGTPRDLTAGSYALLPPGRAVSVEAGGPLALLVLRKRYEPSAGYEQPVGHVGRLEDLPGDVWAGDDGARLQTLLPDDMAFDLAVNVFTFSPGHGLPIVETHVMEHGLYVLEGKGLYLLGRDWAEVQRDDFIWMGPYCPQSFYATGVTPARYLYYKNVNRAVEP